MYLDAIACLNQSKMKNKLHFVLVSVANGSICHPDLNPCLNDGTCVAGYNNETGLRFTCQCTEKYEGAVCQSEYEYSQYM